MLSKLRDEVLTMLVVSKKGVGFKMKKETQQVYTEIVEPKIKASKRIIALDDVTIRYLQERK